MPANTARNPIGSHVKVGRGLVEGALVTAERIGAEAIQVFAGNPRGWAHSPADPRKDAEFRQACKEKGIGAWVHAPYLINLGSPTAATYERSIASIAHNLARAADIGAQGVVVHTGSCVAEGATEQALAQVHDGLMPVLEVLDGDAPWLLLEPTAGQGRSLCAGVDDLDRYLEALEWHPRVGVCLDTCHVFAAGAPLDEPCGTVRTLDRLVEVAGTGRLRLIHANDSKDVRGSMKDRHERIGEGRIGVDGFRDLFTHPATEGVPLILETPGSGEPDSACLPLLKSLRGQV